MDIKDIKVGKSYYVIYNPKEKILIHIRAIVDNSHVVFREWSRFYKKWKYEIRDKYYFETMKIVEKK